MRPLFQAARLVLPILLFGYGITANLMALTGPPTPIRMPNQDLLAGGLTRDFERLYKSTLPHFAPAFGLIGAVRYSLLGEARQGAVVGRDGWLFTSEETRAPLPFDLSRIIAIRDTLADEGTRLILVPLPAKIDVARSHSPDAALSRTAEELDRAFLAALTEAGVQTIDPREALLVPGSFLATDTHWSPLGAARTAAVVARHLPHGPLTFTHGAVTLKPLTGDLVRYVTEDARAPGLGLKLEYITLSALLPTEAPSDIFSAATSDIVLIGTSYSANPDWAFADALTKALGREVENRAAEGQGPLAPMEAWLASDHEPAQVVLWEFPVRYLTDPNLWSALPPQRVAQSD